MTSIWVFSAQRRQSTKLIGGADRRRISRLIRDQICLSTKLVEHGIRPVLFHVRRWVCFYVWESVCRSVGFIAVNAGQWPWHSLFSKRNDNMSWSNCCEDPAEVAHMSFFRQEDLNGSFSKHFSFDIPKNDFKKSKTNLFLSVLKKRLTLGNSVISRWPSKMLLDFFNPIYWGAPSWLQSQNFLQSYLAPLSFLAGSALLYLSWRLWTFTIRHRFYPHDPRDIPYWIPGTRLECRYENHGSKVTVNGWSPRTW